MSQEPIPVMRPRLPSFDAVEPFLRRIDASRVYSNFGPLCCELSDALQAMFGGAVVPTASATVGLSACLTALGLPRGGMCLMPSWTFAAGAHAVLAAGLVPFFADVERNSGAMTPEIARRAAKAMPERPCVVMPTAPFGAPLDCRAWAEFRDAEGIPVVIDAAACFDSVRAADFPQVVSLHATKVLGCGEGGFVLCRDEGMIQRIRAALNFGFAGNRSAQNAAYNGKLSEYHAAIALAALRDWPQSREDHRRVLTSITAALAPRCSAPQGLGLTYVTNTVNIQFDEGAATTAAKLSAAGIETRRWWEAGLHRQPAFASFGRTELPETEHLAFQTLGLPCHRDLDHSAVARIARALQI